MSAGSQVPTLGVTETVALLTALHEALDDLVLATAARFAGEPRLEARHALAAQLYDDARSLAKLRGRLAELPAPAHPAPPVAADAAAVAAVARNALKRIDPAVDDGSLRLLTQLALRQERHVAELEFRGFPRGTADAVDRPEAAATSIALAEQATAALAARRHTDPEERLDLARIAYDAMRHALLRSRPQPLSPEAAEHLDAEAEHLRRLRDARGL